MNATLEVFGIFFQEEARFLASALPTSIGLELWTRHFQRRVKSVGRGAMTRAKCARRSTHSVSKERPCG